MVNSTVQNYEDISQDLDGGMLYSPVYDNLEVATQETIRSTSKSEPVARLVVHTPKKTWDILFKSDRLTIGRDPDNNIVIDEPSVSPRHAYVEHDGKAFTLYDLRSFEGTWLHGERIIQHTLEYGDTIRIGNTKLVFMRGLHYEEDFTQSMADDSKQVRNPVVIIPGFMGSELWAGGDRVWPNVRRLVSRPELFRYPNSLKIGGLVNDIVVIPNLFKLERYSRLVQFLEKGLGYKKGKDLLEFTYDWRQDNRMSARRLAEAVDQWEIDRPITIIAHSMGSLISRYYVERLGGNKKVERLILLGGPHHGTHKSLSALLFGRGLLPFGLKGEQLRKILSTFPSIYQLLPSYPSIFDQSGRPINLFEDATWLPEAQRPLLQNAASFRRELGERCSVPCISVFGYGLKTITRAIVERGHGGAWSKIDFVAEGNGDNTIPPTSAVIPGSEIQPVRQHHGALYADNDVKIRLKLELMRGSQWQYHRLHRQSPSGVLVSRRQVSEGL